MRCCSGLMAGVGEGVGDGGGDGDGVDLAGAGGAVGVVFCLGALLLAARCMGPAVAGRRSTWPTASWSAFERLFSWISVSSDAPLACAMVHRVSPDLTV